MSIARIKSFPLDPAPRALDLFGAAKNYGFRAYWRSPTTTLVAAGEALSHTESPEQLKKLPANARLIGGSRFSPQSQTTASNPDWAAFGSSRLILPTFLVQYEPGQTMLHQAAAGKEIHPDFEEILKKAENPEPEETFTAMPKAVTQDLQQDFLGTIKDAIRLVQESELNKVVLANCRKVQTSVQPMQLLRQLEHKFPECVIFAFGFEDPDTNEESIFLGATPELLLSMADSRVTTSALASSAPRSQDPEIDKSFGQELLGDPKELVEHLLVVDHLIEKLSNGGVNLDPVGDPQLLKLPGIQHLHTPISGDSLGPSVVELLEIISPTPAVAGVPAQRAVEYISEIETFDRGWYSGPVGWCQPNGDGEFYAALRSALLTDNSCCLFAGVGLLENSDPEKELAEMELKLKAVGGLIDAL